VSRPARNRLLMAVFVVVMVLVTRRLPDEVTWASTAVFVPLVALALWVTLPFQRARSLLAKRQFDDAATELAAFEKSLVESGWRRAFASLAVGFYTSHPLAAARNTLGAVRLEQGRVDDAATHFSAALEHDALYAVPWANRAVLAAMKGDRAAAEEARQKAASLGYAPKILARVIADKLAAGKQLA